MWRAVPAVAIAIALGAVGSAPADAAPLTEAVSVTSDGSVGPARGRGSGDAVLSANGRFVAFTSFKRDLVSNDRGGRQDIFVRDMRTGKTTLVSVSSAGKQGNDAAMEPSISPDGRYVVFSSFASNLVKGVRDKKRCTKAAKRFGCEGPQHNDVFRHDTKTGRTTLVSRSSSGAHADADSFSGVLSANGRFVAFASEASNLSADDKNRGQDVFIRDLKRGTTRLVSRTPGAKAVNNGPEAPEISGDGRYVAYESDADNLVQGDTNDSYDLFVRDLKQRRTVRVSVGSNGEQGSDLISAYAISPDGRSVAFSSNSPAYAAGDTNPSGDGDPGSEGYDVFLRDLDAGTTRRVNVGPQDVAGDADADDPAFSGDGRHLAFASKASNLVAGDANGVWDSFVLDLAGGDLQLVSKASDGTQGDANSRYPSLSEDGAYAAFESASTTLAPDPHLGRKDVFRTGPLS